MKRKGITIVEVVIASVVLATMSIPLFSMMFSVNTNQKRSTTRLKAILVLQGSIEEASHNCSVYKSTLPRRIPIYPKELRIIPYTEEISEHLFKITYKAEFQELGKTKTVELNTLCSTMPDSYEIKE